MGTVSTNLGTTSQRAPEVDAIIQHEVCSNFKRLPWSQSDRDAVVLWAKEHNRALWVYRCPGQTDPDAGAPK